MRIMVGLIIVAIVMFILGYLYYFKDKLKSEEGKSQEGFERKTVKENPYTKLRSQAINVTTEQLQIEVEGDKTVYGIVMDWDAGDAIVSVFSFVTGDASVYLSSGQAFVGGFAHETIKKAAKEFVALGQKFIAKAKPATGCEPAGNSKVNFYLLTKSGKYFIEEATSLLETRSSELFKLFEAGNQVLTEHRLIVEQKGKKEYQE